jgi:hypothetical protein
MLQNKPQLPFFSFVMCLLLSLFAHGVAFGGQSPLAVSLSPDEVSSDTIPGNCPGSNEIEKIINEAISLGAPVYNAGMHIACYRIYEWAAYKIRYVYGKECTEIDKTLSTAIDKSHGDYSDTEKAWIMRMAFDKILGQPTQTAEPQKDPPLRKG